MRLFLSLFLELKTGRYSQLYFSLTFPTWLHNNLGLKWCICRVWKLVARWRPESYTRIQVITFLTSASFYTISQPIFARFCGTYWNDCPKSQEYSIFWATLYKSVCIAWFSTSYYFRLWRRSRLHSSAAFKKARKHFPNHRIYAIYVSAVQSLNLQVMIIHIWLEMMVNRSIIKYSGMMMTQV